jgi:hypothetical protein
MKRRYSVFAVIFAVSFLIGIQAVEIVNANPMPTPYPRIYINADGSIQPQTAPIRREGSTYSLSGNIVNFSLVLETDNIVLNGKGHTIQGDSKDTAGSAIIIQPLNYTEDMGRRNITITNLVLKNFVGGVDASYLFDSVITSNTIRCIYAVGLGIHSSSNQVSNNTLVASDQNLGCGISVWGSLNNISQNDVTGFYKGVEIFAGDHNTVTYNTLAVTLPFKLWDNATNSDIQNNTLTETASTSISPSGTSTFPAVPLVGAITLLAVASISLVYFRRRKGKQ